MRKLFLYLGTAVGFAAMLGMLYVERKEADENGIKLRKYQKYYQVLNKWVSNNHKKITNEELLKNMGFSSVAIYGNGEIGSRLVESLKDSPIEVKCIIEKKANDIQLGLEGEISIVGINDTDVYSNVDAIIVTPMFDFDNIVKELSNKGIGAKIVSIEDVVFYGQVE